MDYEQPTEIIKKVGTYLNVPLPKNNLESYLCELESIRFTLAETVTDWHKQVAEMKARMLHPKDKDMTELDRNVMLEAHIAVIRKDYELLVKLEDLIKDRIELGKIILTL